MHGVLRRTETSALIHRLCRDAVEVQRKFDAAWQADVHHVAAVLGHASLVRLVDVFEGLPAALIPRRSMVRSFEIDLRIVVGTTREHRFEVDLTPLNVGYDRRYTTRHETQSRLHIHVEQVPTEHDAEPSTREG